MKKLFLSILFFASIVTIGHAQTATQLIDEVLSIVKTKTIKTDFVLTIKTKASQAQKLTGTFTMKSNKFIMDMNEMEVYFNGKTQWSYSPKTNEVTINEPTDTDLAETNPMAILYSFRATSTVRFASNKSSKTSYFIEMLPKDRHADVTKIVVEINKTSKNLVSITQSTQEGGTMSIVLTNFDKSSTVADAAFNFNPSKYKNIYINDLR